MLIGARTAAWSGGGEPLPYDKEVKCLKSLDGNQYIDANFYINLFTDSIDCKFRSLSTITDTFSGIAGFFGNREGNNYAATVYKYFYRLYFAKSLNGPAGFDGYEQINNPRKAERFLASRNLRRIEIEGVQYGYESTTQLSVDYQFSSTCLVMAVHDGSTVSKNNKGTECYYFKAYRNGDLIRDMIPVVKDGVGYLYDRCESICPITGTPLYANAGTGAFTWEELNA